MTGGLTERERYLFDLNGYVIVRSVLTPEEVRTLNASVSANTHLSDHGDGSDGYKCRFKNFFQWTGEDGHAESWRGLIDHPGLFCKIRDLLGGHGPHRLDHEYGMRMVRGCKGLPLHHGGTPYQPSCSYHCRNGELHNGMIVVSFALTDVNAGDGGFCVVPGSHKSNFRLPAELTSYAQLAGDGALAQPAVRAGDVVIFSEAVAHGTLDWVSPNERRVVMLKYCPGHVAWGTEYLTARTPELLRSLNDRQRAIVQPPFVWERHKLGR